MMKVCNLVLNDFTNDSRVLKVSKSLSDFGFDPVVVAMHNDTLMVDENVEGVKVHRIKLVTRSWPKYKFFQIIKYVEFIFRSVLRFRNVDIVHCNDLSALPVGVIIKIIGKNKKIVYDCHEYETEVNGLTGFEKRTKKILEKSLIRFADAVITVSESIANEYSRIYGISKPEVVLNCPAYSDGLKRDLFREQLGIRMDQTIFLYQGGLNKGRGIEVLLESFSGLDSDENVLVCMGYGPLEMMVKEKSEKHKTIFFHPAVSSSVLLKYTGSADYGVLFYEDTCLNHRYCSPNKIFEYLMAGLPVLTSNLFEMKRLVEGEGLGVVSCNNTVQGFSEAINSSLVQVYGDVRNNVLSVRKKYSWEEQEKVLKRVYGTI